MMQLKIKSITGEEFQIDIETNCTVGKLDSLIREKRNLDENDNLKIICIGKVLKDKEKKISECGIDEDFFKNKFVVILEKKSKIKKNEKVETDKKPSDSSNIEASTNPDNSSNDCVLDSTNNSNNQTTQKDSGSELNDNSNIEQTNSASSSTTTNQTVNLNPPEPFNMFGGPPPTQPSNEENPFADLLTEVDFPSFTPSDTQATGSFNFPSAQGTPSGQTGGMNNMLMGLLNDPQLRQTIFQIALTNPRLNNLYNQNPEIFMNTVMNDPQILQSILSSIVQVGMGNPLGNPMGNPLGNPMDNPLGNLMDNPLGNSLGNSLGNPMNFPTGLQNNQVRRVVLTGEDSNNIDKIMGLTGCPKSMAIEYYIGPAEKDANLAINLIMDEMEKSAGQNLLSQSYIESEESS